MNGGDAPDRPGGYMDGHVGHLLRRGYARARRNTAETLAAIGDVSPVQAAALAALQAGPLHQAELGRRIDMEAANTHTLVARLRSAGLVDPPSSRKAPIALTPEGELLAAQLEPLIQASGARTLAMLDANERALFLRLLRRVVASDGG